MISGVVVIEIMVRRDVVRGSRGNAADMWFYDRGGGAVLRM